MDRPFFRSLCAIRSSKRPFLSRKKDCLCLQKKATQGNGILQLIIICLLDKDGNRLEAKRGYFFAHGEKTHLVERSKQLPARQ